MNKGIVAIIILSILVIGCGEKLTNIFHRDQNFIKIDQIDFDYLSAKMKIDFDGEKRLSGIANLRMQKDSVIWISLSPGLGVEIARILITQDSVAIIDKFNKKYIKTDFERLSKKFSFDINYRLVESILLGNLVIPRSIEKLTKLEQSYQYEQQVDKFLLINNIGIKSHKLEKLQVLDTASKSSVAIHYEDFQLLEDQILPFNISTKLYKDLADVAAIKLDLEYNKAEIEAKPLKFPFSIPQKYERDESI